MCMGALKYAILGLLNRRSMTGYDMAKEFENALFEFWNAKHSQIYPELKQLTEKGLVEYKIEISGNVLEKKIYSITDAGKAELAQWAVTPHKIPAATKDEFRLQLFFSDSIDNEQRLNILSAKLAEHENKLAHLRQKSAIFDHIADMSDAAEAEFTDYLVWLGAVKREESCCDWLRKCIELCENK